MKEFVLVPMMGQNMSRSSVQPWKTVPRNSVVLVKEGTPKPIVSSEERGKEVFATVPLKLVHLKLVFFCDFGNDL